MNYQIGKTEEVSKGLYLKLRGSSFESIVSTLGKNEMYWYRALLGLGRNSIVGTTVKNVMPSDILVDEKHSWINGNKVYIATTVSEGCILGSAISESSDEDGLTESYKQFKYESEELEYGYSPDTINTDGWGATQKSMKKIFPYSKLIQCFLHAVLKVKNRLRSWEKRNELMTKIWDVYKAETVRVFSQRIRRLKKFVLENNIPSGAKEKVIDLCNKSGKFKLWYKDKKAHRTSNMIDRLMDFQDRFLYNMKYFHGNLNSGNLLVRSMALCWNFHPYVKRVKRKSPFEDLNGFVYHENWLENLMIAASLGGKY